MTEVEGNVADDARIALNGRGPRTFRRGSIIRGLALAIALLILGASWALSSPVGSSPDDDFHMGSIWCSDVLRRHTCEPAPEAFEDGQRRVLVPIAIAAEPLACFAFKPAESAACTQPIVDRGGLGASRANDGAYPTGFYAFMSLFVSSAPSRSIILLRMISWTLCVALVAASVLVSQGATRRSKIVAVAVTSVPLMLFIFASVNPSGLTIAGCTAYVFSGIAALNAPDGRAWRSAAIVAVLSALCALVSRPDAGVWVALGSVTIVLYSVRRRDDITRRVLLPAITALVGTAYFLLLGGSSAVQSGIVNTPDSRSFGDTWFTNLTEVTSLWAGIFGTWGLGWLDTTLPTVVWFCSLGAAMGAVVIGLGAIDRHGIRVLSWQLVVILVVPLYLLAADHAVVGETVQPRYLLPAFPVIVALALLDSPGARARETFKGAQLGFIGVLLAIANSAALHGNMRRYVWGLDRNGFDLGVQGEWSWNNAPPPMVLWAMGTVAGAVAIVLLFRTSSSAPGIPERVSSDAEPPPSVA